MRRAARHRRILILGGTTEARELAARLVERHGRALDVVTAQAGRTRAPRAVRGILHRGGFGGAAGLASFLRRERIDALVDATHPFATRMKAQAIAAARAAGTPFVTLRRGAWPRVSGDRWIEVEDGVAAASAAAALGRRIFLTLGHRDLEAFAAIRDRHFLVRTIEPPLRFDFASAELLLARGPFALDAERALMRAHRIDVLVTKASGGDATYAKIAAARELGLPVVVIRRGAPPEAPSVGDVDAAVAWVRRRLRLGAGATPRRG
ncbi:MAG: cobalt-precorrin-6A reductase [Alphaproteobacteria bacterium]|nr:cobalt-precorrin-6A reductase [Alphaproteobacteria bacterium]